MSQYSKILCGLSQDAFARVFAASARKAREAIFAHYKVRKPRSVTGLPRPGATTEHRVAALYDVLQTTDDEELAEALLRAWLLTKRPMLAAALDHLAISHNQGLTDSNDVEKFTKLSVRELRALATKLDGTAPRDEIAIYLKFMGAEKVDEALADTT